MAGMLGIGQRGSMRMGGPTRARLAERWGSSEAGARWRAPARRVGHGAIARQGRERGGSTVGRERGELGWLLFIERREGEGGAPAGRR
jgi:hypothetical protein